MSKCAVLEPPNPTYPPIAHYPTIKLRVWKNDFGLPSFDPDCLIIMTLLKMYNVKFEILYSYFPLINDIPSLQYNNKFIPKGRLMPYIMDNLCNERAKFYKPELKRIELYKKYFIDSFAQTFIFDCWINDANFTNTMETWYKHVVPFPFAHKYILRMRKRVQRKYENCLRFQDPEKYMEKLYETAELCLSDFESLLEDHRMYLYNNTPTSLDATVYSYLIVALYMPMEHSRLQDMVAEYTRLKYYICNISEKFFPNTPRNFKYVEPVFTRCCLPASHSSVIFATICISSAMIASAIHKGLFEPRIPNFIREIDWDNDIIDPAMVEYFFEFIILPFGLFIP